MGYRIGGSVVILIGIALFLVLQGATNASQIQTSLSTVKVLQVTSADQVQQRNFPAKVVASSSANLATKVGGQVKIIYVEPGDLVKKGDTLLEIDPVDYQLGYEQAEANLTLAQATYNRIYASFQKGVSTQSDLDNVKAQLDLAQIALKQARNSLTDTKLIAPYDAIVVRVDPEEHEFVSPQTPLVFIQSREAILVEFQVPSDIIATVGDVNNLPPATVRFDAMPKQSYPATIKEFSIESDASTRAYDVTLQIPLNGANNIRLLPGMEATVELKVDRPESTGSVVVPSHAVFMNGDQASVWVVNEDHVVRTNVELGSLRNNGIEVNAGLNAGDVIVVAGVYQLTDNQMINVWAGE
ncbi:efflux RND transporter periplasmic adaptor subunit [Reinekea marinisedimentorum]|uniref:RND family efflux transporter MFP subunit n=1 Tax=Reinekea marinisedimentorum TaxID=230495 RepID=A0A4R3HZC0_9GAMM|nr:efflux RND transporter periplasmic adaptor subunit [Reinekea marinisedimentorum]TCS37691.1 RND family efflux transporter MFP subunit [Reinekea marinisedimentorum]